MPFKKVGKNDYVSPSGRHWTKSQMALYYLTDHFRKMGKATKTKHKKSDKDDK